LVEVADLAAVLAVAGMWVEEEGASSVGEDTPLAKQRKDVVEEAVEVVVLNDVAKQLRKNSEKC
uniref:CPSF73-100_C domain-containing protein n=1 Tax=Haemonchus placei TaxID=6290 RepID=A0A0N4X0A9_HAEPC